jgi:hypothetical protein
MHEGSKPVQEIINSCIKKIYGSELINGPNAERKKREFEQALDKSSSDMSPKARKFFYESALSEIMSRMIIEMQVRKLPFLHKLIKYLSAHLL